MPPRIVSSALRPLRLSGHHLHPHSQAGRTTATYASPSKPKPTYPVKPATITPFKRTATTSSTSTPFKPASATKSPSTTPTSTSASTNRTYKPAASSTAPSSNGGSSSSSSTPSKPPPVVPTTAYAAMQLDPIQGTPYQPPPNAPPLPDAPADSIDWSSSFHGLSTAAFPPEVAKVLMAPLPFDDVEIKPDGIIYLPEIKYRRILNTAFGPGGWGMAPRSDLAVGERIVTREYALLVHGRFIAQARGECGYFGGDDGIATAGEGCKSNALMRCCKDLGIASELWDPRFIRAYKKSHAQEIWVEHVSTKKKRLITVRKGDEPGYPYKKS